MRIAVIEINLKIFEYDWWNFLSQISFCYLYAIKASWWDENPHVENVWKIYSSKYILSSNILEMNEAKCKHKCKERERLITKMYDYYQWNAQMKIKHMICSNEQRTLNGRYSLLVLNITLYVLYTFKIANIKKIFVKLKSKTSI